MKFCLFGFSLFITLPLFGQEPAAKRISQHVRYLAADKMQGRGTGSPENAKAARYIEKYFKNYGLKPLGTDGYYQSFTAKVVDPSKVRTLTGIHRSGSPAHEETPPIPQVDWTIATHELSKLLTPTNRQIFSCRPEELAEVRVKKERQSIAAIPPTDRGMSGRQLRDRKAKAPTFEPIPTTTSTRSVSRSSSSFVAEGAFALCFASILFMFLIINYYRHLSAFHTFAGIMGRIHGQISKGDYKRELWTILISQ